MKKQFLIISMFFAATTLFAQSNIENVLQQIEANNTTLKALKASVEAQKLENKSGTFLPDPEVEFNYLWGSPQNIGNRNDILLTQSFDIQTVTGMKSRFSNKKNALLDTQYYLEKTQILLQARLFCVELIFCNALQKTLAERLQNAQTLADAYQTRLDKGDVSILEHNRAQLNFSAVRGEFAKNEMQRGELLSELQQLNGNQVITFDLEEYENALLPETFDTWYANMITKIPALQLAQQEIEVSRQQVSLNKAMNLPTFSAGFMREKTFGQAYNGLTIGVSVPLWENKNRVKQAQAAVSAAELREKDLKNQFFSRLQTLYNRAKNLQKIATDYRNTLKMSNNTELLQIALDKGEISLLEYIVELDIYYQNHSHALAAERDFQQALATLVAASGK